MNLLESKKIEKYLRWSLITFILTILRRISSIFLGYQFFKIFDLNDIISTGIILMEALRLISLNLINISLLKVNYYEIMLLKTCKNINNPFMVPSYNIPFIRK